jgi:hypothetical protein
MYKGETGINEINNRIQEAIDPSNGGTELKRLNRVFRLRDKVIQLVNRAEKGVMNGDIGYVSGFTKKNDKISGVEVSFDLHVVSYELEELDDLTLAYAISIHKSQGSEFELVIMPFTTQYYVMLKRKLIYTGITRAKKTLLLIGDPQAMHLGIRKIEIERKTILKEELKKYLYSDSISSSLSKLLNDAGITEISKGTNLQNLLLSLFCKRNWPKDIKSVSGTLYANSGINSFSVTANPDRLMEPGETVYFSATQGSVKGYGTTNSSVTGLTYGYSTSNNNIKDGDNTSFSKS